ncbi:hypothetical protein [Flavitalea sp.]|nr:hypothetical protein [Flavitalea sp.]
MTDLPGKWRIFKALSIIQMITAIFMLVISIGGIFYGDNFFWRAFEGLCYGLMLIFLYQGFTILNDNYPDTPLSLSQKRNFNILFLLNFLLIAFLFAKVVVQWRFVRSVITGFTLEPRGQFLVLLPLIMATLLFILNVVHLAGMYRLRTMLYENNQKKIDDEFINDD